MTNSRLVASFLLLLVSAAPGVAFNGNVAIAGPLTLSIADVPLVKAADAPQPCHISLANQSQAPLDVTVELRGLLEGCRVIGPVAQRVVVPAGGKASVTCEFACGDGTYSAHYPLHVFGTFRLGGIEHTAHAIQIFQTDLTRGPIAAREFPISRVAEAGALALTSLKGQRVAWQYRDQPLVHLPVGWSGSDATSSASFTCAPMTRGGVAKPTLQMHPPYRPQAGTIFAEYRLRLPATTPIHFSFFNAIRDSTPREGTSDGVTFRVWVGDEVLFERHTDAKVWTPGEVDLSRFAGREILLRLESHPGPRHNTTCDSSFWGDPVVAAGPPPKIQTAAEREALFGQARQILGGRASPAAGGLLFELAGGCRAVVIPGPHGLADGAIGFGNRDRQVLFGGLLLAVREQVLGAWPSAVTVQNVEARRDPNGRLSFIHHLRLDDRAVDLVTTLWAEGPALRIKVECPEPITGLALNAADQRAARVYYGHGYCITEPQAFRATVGGHNLATSHVGFDFAQGVSLLTASDTPVDHLQVDPDRQLYQLHTHPDATLTFVPGLNGALDCAVRYRPLSDKTAAPGVDRKAGRFVFDLWGGRYADDAARLSRCFDYGLTHALVVMHVWQRWGYDYRLPDIFPPLPSLGTLEELQELGRLCTSRGVLWGLHDNYIDIYPDATGFSYDEVTFSADGKPRRAWLNESREAQSYQFRPDRIRPFVQRNLDLIVPALHPTSYFVDVFSSLSSFDFYDRQGRFHSKRETQRAWGEAFAAIRDACGGNAPTVSEAGGDHLIGWLDGADAQFMLLSSQSKPFHNLVRCREWSRVPWFDAVHHTRFSLHGVGYSDRYQGGRSREDHGIESDDYLSAEMLTGHALMIDLTSLGRGAVRKYWLAQDFIASIARDDIRSVEFAGDDIQRLVITWNSGARVHVNRGESDWNVGGRVLPQYGYLARHGAIESSIERFAAGVAEQSRAPGRYYWNGRGFNPAAPLAITPQAERVEYLGGRQFRLLVNWHAQRPAARELGVFYTFSRSTPGRRALTEFSGGGNPPTPTTQWQGRIQTGSDWTITVPPEMPLGEYEILVGLQEPGNRGRRERLLGDEDQRRRYRVGKLVVEGEKPGSVTGVHLVPPAEPYVAPARQLINTSAVDFGPAQTAGGFRCTVERDHLVVTPLPDGADFEVQLRLDALLGRAVQARAVEAIAVDGAARGAVAHSLRNGWLTFTARKADFAYRVRFE